MAKIEITNLKNTREHLCILQQLILNTEHKRKMQIAETLTDLIARIDIHRPLRADGKHGDLHTATCGCKDVVGTYSTTQDELDPLLVESVSVLSDLPVRVIEHMLELGWMFVADQGNSTLRWEKASDA